MISLPSTLLDLLLRPISGWPPLASLAVVSLVVAAGVLAAFRFTSNQPALSRAKRGVAAALLELRIFQDDPFVVLRSVGDLLAHQGRYLRYAMTPLLWVGAPLVLLLVLLEGVYGRAALAPGDATVVVVRLAQGAVDPKARPRLSLAAPDGLRVETPGVWAPARRETAWRVRADRTGDFVLRVEADGTPLERRVRVADRLVTTSEPAPRSRLVDAIDVDYPPRDLRVFGRSAPWLLVFFVYTLLFTLLLRPLFRVTL